MNSFEFDQPDAPKAPAMFGPRVRFHTRQIDGLKLVFRRRFSTVYETHYLRILVEPIQQVCMTAIQDSVSEAFRIWNSDHCFRR